MANFNITVGDSDEACTEVDHKILYILMKLESCNILKLVLHFSSPSCRIFVKLILIIGRGSIVVRAHASRAEGLRLEPDSMP